MKCSLLCALFLLFGAGTLAAFNSEKGGASARPGPANSAYDTPSFVAILNRLADNLNKKPSSAEMTALRASLPESWTVSTADRAYTISSRPLRDELAAKSSEKARVWVHHMIAEVEGFSSGNAIDVREARTELDNILARPDFGGIRPPTPWEVLRQRVAAWLQRQLVKLFGAIGRHPIGGEILFWIIVLGGIVGIAFAMIRFLAGRDNFNSLSREEAMITARLWQEWLRAAREAANRGDFREAVHSAYWAGIVKLQDIDALPRDRTKTPREYLSLITQEAAKEFATATPVREPLAALTSRLELVWYAHRGAGPEDFRESLHQLEALGCHLE
jgi:hypothetical protein